MNRPARKRTLETSHERKARIESLPSTFSEKEKFFQNNTDLIMKQRELKALIRIAEDENADVKTDSEELIKELAKDYYSRTGNLQLRNELIAESVKEGTERVFESAAPRAEQNRLANFVQERFFDEWKSRSGGEKTRESFQEMLKNSEVRFDEENLRLQFEKMEQFEEDLEVQDLMETITAEINSRISDRDKPKDALENARKTLFTLVEERIDDPELKKRTKQHLSAELVKAWGFHAETAESIAENFFVTDQISFGGQGEVYLAQDLETNEKVVVKLLAVNVRDNVTGKIRRADIDSETAEKFQKEINAIKGIDHPNVVKFKGGEVLPTDRLEGGNFDHEGWFAMQYLEGKDINELLNEKSFSAKEAARIGVQLTRALKAIHEKGLVHKDIKPHNIIVSGEGDNLKVTVIDFGLAQESGSADNEAPSGTPAFMSPEQVLGMEITGSSDVFSLGSVFYTVLTRKLAFDPDRNLNAIGVMDQVSQEDPNPPSEVNPSIPQELSDFILQMLKKNPEDRPSLQEVEEFLGIFLMENQAEEQRKRLLELLGHEEEPSVEEIEESLRALAQESARPSSLDDSMMMDREFDSIAADKESLEMSEVAELIITTSPYANVTVAYMDSEFQKLGFNFTKEKIQDILQNLVLKGVLERGRGRTQESYRVAEKYEVSGEDDLSAETKESLQNTPETQDQGNQQPLAESEFDDFFEGGQPAYETEGVSLEEIQKFVERKTSFKRVDIEEKFSLTGFGASDALNDLREQGIIAYDPKLDNYSPVNQKKGIINFFRNLFNG